MVERQGCKTLAIMASTNPQLRLAGKTGVAADRRP
jgi:hypothetical protein